MTNLPTWEVDLFIVGPIKTSGTHELKVFKAFRYDDPFYSDIEIRTSDTGVNASVTAFASTNDLAHKAALIFFGQMLDALALEIKQPLFLSLTHTRPAQLKQFTIRRVVEKDEWIAAFKESRCLNEYEPTFLRALGWYRKGLYTEDPFDKFLAFWNSVEIIASKYHTKDERTKKGIKNQIWQCFELLWGECKDWPIIRGNDEWINSNYDLRKDIAHGLKPVTVSSVESILSKLKDTEEVAHTFLKDWKKNKIPIDDHLSALLAHIGIESH
jgi:hypothetical protein